MHHGYWSLFPPAIKLVRPETTKECFLALVAGDVDIVAVDSYHASGLIAAWGMNHVVLENPNLMEIMPLNVMVHKSNPDGEAVLETLNRGLSTMQQSGEWRDIVSKALEHHLTNNGT